MPSNIRFSIFRVSASPVAQCHPVGPQVIQGSHRDVTVPQLLFKKKIKITKSGLTCLKSPFLIDNYTFGGICSKLSCGQDRGHTSGRAKAQGLAVIHEEFFLTIHPKPTNATS